MQEFYGFPVEEDDEMAPGTAELGYHDIELDDRTVSVTITGIGTGCDVCGEDHTDDPDPHPSYVFPEVIEGTMANARAEWGRARREAAMQRAVDQWPEGWTPVGASTDEDRALDHWVGPGSGVDPSEPVSSTVADAVNQVMEEQTQPATDYVSDLCAHLNDAAHEVVAHNPSIMDSAGALASMGFEFVARSLFLPPSQLPMPVVAHWAGHRVLAHAVEDQTLYVAEEGTIESPAWRSFAWSPAQPARPRQTHRDRREAMDRWLSRAGYHVEDYGGVEAHESGENPKTELCWASLADFSSCNEPSETEVGLCEFHATEMRGDG